MKILYYPNERGELVAFDFGSSSIDIVDYNTDIDYNSKEQSYDFSDAKFIYNDMPLPSHVHRDGTDITDEFWEFVSPEQERFVMRQCVRALFQGEVN